MKHTKFPKLMSFLKFLMDYPLVVFIAGTLFSLWLGARHLDHCDGCFPYCLIRISAPFVITGDYWIIKEISP